MCYTLQYCLLQQEIIHFMFSRHSMKKGNELEICHQKVLKTHFTLITFYFIFSWYNHYDACITKKTKILEQLINLLIIII